MLTWRSLPGIRRWRPKSETLGIVVKVAAFVHYIDIAASSRVNNSRKYEEVRFQIADALRRWWRHASYVDRLVCSRRSVVRDRSAVQITYRRHIFVTLNLKSGCWAAHWLSIYGWAMYINNEKLTNYSRLKKVCSFDAALSTIKELLNEHLYQCLMSNHLWTLDTFFPQYVLSFCGVIGPFASA